DMLLYLYYDLDAVGPRSFVGEVIERHRRVGRERVELRLAVAVPVAVRALLEVARQLYLARLRVVLRNRLLHARLRDDDRLDVQPPHALYVVQGEDVRQLNPRQR